VLSSLFQPAVFCLPASRYSRACCGHLFRTTFFVPQQTDTVRLIPTCRVLFTCGPIQRSLLRSVSAAFLFPADRYITTCCGQCVPAVCVLVCLQADTVRLVAVSVFQLAVFLFACRPIQHGLLWPFCYTRVYFGSACHVT
jgi:hypothetical protein